MPIFGIILTIICCYGATGNWGSSAQIISIASLGAACVIADLKGLNKC